MGCVKSQKKGNYLYLVRFNICIMFSIGGLLLRGAARQIHLQFQDTVHTYIFCLSLYFPTEELWAFVRRMVIYIACKG